MNIHLCGGFHWWRSCFRTMTTPSLVVVERSAVEVSQTHRQASIYNCLQAQMLPSTRLICMPWNENIQDCSLVLPFIADSNRAVGGCTHFLSQHLHICPILMHVMDNLSEKITIWTFGIHLCFWCIPIWRSEKPRKIPQIPQPSLVPLARCKAPRPIFASGHGAIALWGWRPARISGDLASQNGHRRSPEVTPISLTQVFKRPPGFEMSVYHISKCWSISNQSLNSRKTLQSTTKDQLGKLQSTMGRGPLAWGVLVASLGKAE